MVFLIFDFQKQVRDIANDDPSSGFWERESKFGILRTAQEKRGFKDDFRPESILLSLSSHAK
jgi:hypothetical protein